MSRPLSDAVEVALRTATTPDVSARADSASVAAALAGLFETLARHLDGARVLLVTVVELLERLVGEGLATRLVAQAWPCTIPDAAGRRQSDDRAYDDPTASERLARI